jgi:hypothetical protein
MDTFKFLGLSCFIFVFVGPLIPMPAMAIHFAISTGKLNNAFEGMSFPILFMSYFVGALSAFKVGITYTAVLVLLVRFLPRLIPKQGAGVRIVFGVLVGATIGCGFYVPDYVGSLVRNGFHYDHDLGLEVFLHGLWRAEFYDVFFMLILPSIVCGAIVASWLLPKLIANRVDNGV